MTARHTSPLERLLVEHDFDADIYSGEPMARHTTYKIGGPARYFLRVNRLGSLRRLIALCNELEIPWTVVGRGSNLLVADEGFDGVIITLGDDFRSHRSDKETATITAGAGVALSAVVQQSFRDSFEGLEFAVGTPGTIGGAVFMNAGSTDEWIGQRVATVTVLTPDGAIERRRGSEIGWDYRHSSIGPDEVVLETELALKAADPFFIHGKMEANLARRKRTQPLGEPSCGSVFKNPVDPADPSRKLSAAALIESAGLKGRQVGGAQISPVHANFIVNCGGAAAADVVALMRIAIDAVALRYGIVLKPEVRLLGFGGTSDGAS